MPTSPIFTSAAAAGRSRSTLNHPSGMSKIAGRARFYLLDAQVLNGHADTSVVMNNEVPITTASQAEETIAREEEILTVMEVARFLRVPKSTVYKLARVGELPASKIGKHWRFLRRDIHEWMHGRSRQG